MRQKRKRKPRTLKPWARVHSELAEIFKYMKVKKASKEYYTMTYYGTAKSLKKSCIKILNTLESMDKELEYGLSSEDRWS